jgi:polyprenyl P-hydroxybenzoate/phenylacrylic acid decarboxylase-like protein
MTPKRLVVGISGASGAPLAVHLLQEMQSHPDWETHVVFTRGGARTLAHETGLSERDLASLATDLHAVEDIGASIASGTFKTQGMIVIPCSMKTVSGICHGYADNLLLRAADVTLKERRPLVLVTRETPLSRIHLNNMTTLAEMGVVIMPPVMTFYTRPESVRDMSRHIVGKGLEVFGVELPGMKRWGE